MQRAIRLGRSLSDFGTEMYNDQPTTPMTEAGEESSLEELLPVDISDAFRRVAKAAGREAHIGHYEAEALSGQSSGLKLSPENNLRTEWPLLDDPANGLATRGAAHAAQLTKATTGGFTRLEVRIRTGYERVSFGVLVATWKQVWGKRLGYGVVPYVRYVTSGGAATNWFGSNPGQDAPDIQTYLKGTAFAEEAKLFLDGVRALTPHIIGWVEDDPSRLVWSEGRVATATVIACLDVLKDNDEFYAPREVSVEL